MTNNKKTKDHALQEAKQIEKSIEEALESVKTGESTKDMIVAGYLSLAIQHHSSIILLIENHLPSAAAALNRPLVDATYRGTWFTLIGDDEIAKNFNEGNYELKQTYKLAKQIDKYIEENSNDVDISTFHHIYEQNSSILHGMTHGGMEQIGRQFSEDGRTITSTFSNEELVELLVSSDTTLAMMLLAFGINISDDKLMGFARKLILTD